MRYFYDFFRVFLLIGVAVLLLLSLLGCASRTLTDADREALPPFPYAYRALTQGYVARYFRDPEGAQIEFCGVPEPAYRSALLGAVVTDRGWVWRTMINAINGFGGYTGWLRYDLYLDDRGRLWMFKWSPFLPYYHRYRYDPNRLWATEEEVTR